MIGLGITGKLRRTLESTNACESMIDTVRTTQRNVKHWSSGEMGLRWTAAGMLEAEKQFRKVIGHTDLPGLAIAIERQLHLHQPNPPTTRRPRSQSLCNDHHRDRRHRNSTATGTTSSITRPAIRCWRDRRCTSSITARRSPSPHTKR